jgi:hypothetical protein
MAQSWRPLARQKARKRVTGEEVLVHQVSGMRARVTVLGDVYTPGVAVIVEAGQSSEWVDIYELEPWFDGGPGSRPSPAE